METRSLSDEIYLSNKQQPDDVSVTENKDINLCQIVLKNGLVIVLRPTPNDSHGNKILMHGFSRRGVNSVGEDPMVERLAPSLIIESGVGTFHQEELSLLSRVTSASVFPYINQYFAGFDGSCSPQSLETMLQLVYLYITAPRKDTAVFNAWLINQKKNIQSRLDVNDSLSFYLPLIQGQVFYDERRLDELTLSEAFKAYENVFNAMDNLTMIFSGNFETENVKAVILKYASNIPLVKGTVKLPEERKAGNKLRYPKNKVIRSSSIKDAARIELRFVGLFDYNEKNKVTASVVRRVIQDRLFHRLREQEGGTYYVNTGMRVSNYPQESLAFQIGFESSTQNKDKLIAAAWDEIENLKKSGPTEEELIIARREEIKYVTGRERTGSFWISYLETQYKEQRDIEEIVRYNKLVDSTTASDIQRFVQMYLREGNYYQLELVQ